MPGDDLGLTSVCRYAYMPDSYAVSYLLEVAHDRLPGLYRGHSMIRDALNRYAYVLESQRVHRDVGFPLSCSVA